MSARSRVTTLLLICVCLASLYGCGSGDRSGSGAEASGQASEETQRAQLAPRPGSKGPAPGVPTSKGGDNSIQTYGLEASDQDRQRLSALVHAYLDARASENWRKACAALIAEERQMFERMARAMQLDPPSCAAAEAATTAPHARPILAAEAKIAVLSLRMGPRYAFLIYRRPGEGVFATALGRQGASWKVISVYPTPLE